MMGGYIQWFNIYMMGGYILWFTGVTGIYMMGDTFSGYLIPQVAKIRH